jgi:hypothetical protein
MDASRRGSKTGGGEGNGRLLTLSLDRKGLLPQNTTTIANAVESEAFSRVICAFSQSGQRKPAPEETAINQPHTLPSLSSFVIWD